MHPLASLAGPVSSTGTAYGPLPESTEFHRRAYRTGGAPAGQPLPRRAPPPPPPSVPLRPPSASPLHFASLRLHFTSPAGGTRSGTGPPVRPRPPSRPRGP